MHNRLRGITIQVNGLKRSVPEETTLEQLISLLDLQKKSIVIEHNRQVADKTTYATIQLKESDQIEVVYFVGGG